MYITRPQQALCTDRTRLTGGKNPDDWIAPSLPEDASLISFHFFVSWNTTPPTVSKEVVLTRLVHFGEGETEAGVDGHVLLDLFMQSVVADFEAVERACCPYGQQVRAVLLPEIPLARIGDETPVWLVERSEKGFQLVTRTVRALRAFIQRESGGPVWVGSKGLTYGTSAIECYLSKSDAAYPGDVDAVACDAKGNLLFIVEYKKHTLDAPIGEHLAERYYPKPDGRKYKRLIALANHYGRGGKRVPFVILYYSTKSPIIRLQQVCELSEDVMTIEKDSGDINIGGLKNEQVASVICHWIGN